MAKYDAFIFKKKKKDVSGILVDASSMIPSRNKFGTVGIFENQEDCAIFGATERPSRQLRADSLRILGSK